MCIYSKVTNNAAVGATANTFDALTSITLRSDARKTLGFWVEAAPATATAAEQVTGQIRLSSSDLGIGSQVYSCPPYCGGSPATNIGFSTHNAEYIPFVNDAKGKEVVDVAYSTNLPDPTAANSVVAALLYDAGKTSSLGAESMRTWPDMAPIARGAQNTSTATVTTVAETAMTALTVPAWATEIVGFKAIMVPNLMTAGEEVVGFVRFRSTIPDFEPQEWPFRAAIGAPLGTPVGLGANPQQMFAMGTSFPMTGQSETITPNVVLNVAITTGHACVATVYYR